MRQTKFTIDQIIKILAEADLPGSSVSQVARKYNISPNTIYRWRQKYKGLSSKTKRLKVLEEENLKLKKLLAEKELQIQILTYSFPSFGYRKITAILKQMGYHVNHKRIYRIYKLLNLQKSTSKGYKKKLLRIPFKPINPSKINELWSLDVIEDTLQKNGFVKKIRILNLIDVFSRFAFPPLVDISLANSSLPRLLSETMGQNSGLKTFRKL